MADQYRNKIADLQLDGAATLPAGESQFTVEFPAAADVRFDLTVWAIGNAEEIKR